MYLSLALITMLILSNIFQDPQNILNGEIGIVENIQLILLILNVYLLVKFRKLFIKKYKNLFYNLRLLFFVVLTYEELSWISADKFSFSNYNYQSEINIHNLDVFNFYIIKDIQFIGNIGLFPILISTFLFILGIGNFIFNKRISFLFLEKKYFPFTFIYLINLLISSLIRYYSQNDFYYLIGLEYVELFIYLLFTLDIFKKIRKFKE